MAKNNLDYQTWVKILNPEQNAISKVGQNIKYRRIKQALNNQFNTRKES